MNDNIMIALAIKREGFGCPLLKWHRVIANTFLKSKISSSHETMMTHIA